MFPKLKRKRLPLKNVYYLNFIFLIVLPLLIVLLAALLILNQQFKEQAIENIKRAQETVIAELKSDIEVMSMRLSHLIYTNNNEILRYAAGTATEDGNIRYEYQQKLFQAGNLALEPVKSIASVGFYMKDGSKTYIKNEINRTTEEIRKTSWYQEALEKSNTVCVGSYDTDALNDLYKGGKKDMLILVFALAPDVTTDRSQKVEMVAFYQSTGAADRIKTYNRNYLAGENKLGITKITDDKGSIVFTTEEEEHIDISKGSYTRVETSISLNDTTWMIQNFIKTSELTADYWDSAMLMLFAAVLILMLAGYFSRYFVRGIVKPIEEISGGLRQVEEGNLEVHIIPGGQFEVRNMIHQFNAMVRRLKALIEEYEERARGVEKNPNDYLAAMIRGEMTAGEVNAASKEFFAEGYCILVFYIEGYQSKEQETDSAAKLAKGFERNPRFASRCLTYLESSHFFQMIYRIREEDYASGVIRMIKELQTSAAKEFGVHITACIGGVRLGCESFEEEIKDVRSKICLRHIEGENAIIDLSSRNQGIQKLFQVVSEYDKLAGALYIADEKNMVEERDKLFELFNHSEMEEIRLHVYAVILSIGNCFSRDNSSFADVFGQQYNYIEKVSRIEEIRSLKLWLTNFFAWIMDYSASKLSVSETDVMIKAKRYIVDRYENADLSLASVAEYVELNEKYFTNRFTKETGETFSNYLTGLRMQKARELLKTTSFKIYEISEMVGYNNVEHFNRMFKKLNGISPAQYRKTI